MSVWHSPWARGRSGGSIWGNSLWPSARFTPISLFSNGEQGAWYDPSDLTTLYQDAAGRTPVTADGDPVGLMLDLHESISFEARRNLLTYTEALDAPPWVTQNGITSASGLTAPNGSLGFSLTPRTGDNTAAGVYLGGISVANRRLSAYVKRGSKTWAVLLTSTGTRNCWFNLDTMTVGTMQAGLAAPEMVGLSDGWVRVSVTLTVTAGGSQNAGIFAADSNGELSCAGDGSVGLYVGGPQMEAGSSTTGYQPVDALPRSWIGNHATQSTSAARPIHSSSAPLQVYDNVDDAMNVTLPAIAAATVAIATPTGADIQYPVDLSSGSYTITESHSGIIIREGELTAAEQQQVTDYLNAQAGV